MPFEQPNENSSTPTPAFKEKAAELIAEIHEVAGKVRQAWQAYELLQGEYIQRFSDHLPETPEESDAESEFRKRVDEKLHEYDELSGQLERLKENVGAKHPSEN